MASETGSMQNWYGSRIVSFIVPEIEYNFPRDRRPAHVPSLYRDFMSLTKINRTGTTFASFIGGAGFAAGFAPALLPVLLYGLVTIVFTYVSISILNDVLDSEADRLNDPERPVARGALSPNMALMLAAVTFGLGVLLAFSFSLAFGIFSLVEFGMGLLYCYWAKRSGLFSYMLLGCTHIAFPFLAGTILLGKFGMDAALIGAYVFLTMFLGIVIKDFKDIEGDRLTGVRSFPIIYGVKNAYKITAFGFLLAPLTFFIPWFFYGLSAAFLAFYVIVAAWKLRMARYLLSFPNPAACRKVLDQFRFAVMGEMLAWGLAYA